MTVLGILGGSGVYDIAGLEKARRDLRDQVFGNAV